MNMKKETSINIKATNMELTDAIRDYVERRIAKAVSLVENEGGDTVVVFEVGKTTRHHQKGDVFRAEINIRSLGKMYRAEAVEADLYAAIDRASEIIFREVGQSRNRWKTLMVRGARSLKKRIKGLQPWSGRRGK